MARKQSISSEMIDKQLDDNFLDRVNEDDDSSIHVTQGTPLQLRSPEKNDASRQKDTTANTQRNNAAKKPINVYTNPANGPVNLKLDSGHHLNITVSGASSDCDGASDHSGSRLMGAHDSKNGSFKDNHNENKDNLAESENICEASKEFTEENGVIRQPENVANDKNIEAPDPQTPVQPEVDQVTELERKNDKYSNSRSCLLDNKETTGAS